MANIALLPFEFKRKFGGGCFAIYHAIAASHPQRRGEVHDDAATHGSFHWAGGAPSFRWGGGAALALRNARALALRAHWVMRARALGCARARIGLCARNGRLQRASTPRWLRRRRRRRRCKAVGALPRTGSLIISSTKAGNSRRAAGRGRWLSKARNLWPYQMAPVSMLPVAGMLLVAGDGIRRPPGWPRKAAGGGGSASRLSCPSWQAVAPAAPAG